MRLEGDEYRTLVALRRELHRQPELRFEEHRTSATLAKRLSEFAEVRESVGRTGLIATVPGRSPGRSVLFRADMDAYPVTDGKTVPYASTSPGISHACGHDVHMTVAYGLAARLAADPPEQGTLTVLFQPAEEVPFGAESGAAVVLAEDPFAGHRFDAVLGLHCWPDLPAGSIGVDPVSAMAAKDAFQIVLRGTSAHAATPAKGRDAIVCLSSLVVALHAATARGRDPNELIAFNVGTIRGGASQSLVADYAEATGTLRSLGEAARARLKGVIEQMARQYASAHDVDIEFAWANEMPAVRNEPWLVRLARERLPAATTVVDLPVPPLTTDDFALLDTLGSSLYVKLGIAGDRGGAPLHSGDFDVDERCIRVGVDAMELLVRSVLSGTDSTTATPS